MDKYTSMHLERLQGVHLYPTGDLTIHADSTIWPAYLLRERRAD